MTELSAFTCDQCRTAISADTTACPKCGFVFGIIPSQDVPHPQPVVARHRTLSNAFLEFFVSAGIWMVICLAIGSLVGFWLGRGWLGKPKDYVEIYAILGALGVASELVIAIVEFVLKMRMPLRSLVSVLIVLLAGSAGIVLQTPPYVATHNRVAAIVLLFVWTLPASIAPVLVTRYRNAV